MSKNKFTYKSNVKNVKNAIENAEERTLEAIGTFIDGETVARCPVEYGNLKSSYTHEVDMQEKNVTNGTPSDYAIWVEKGTGKYAEDGNGRKTPWTYKSDDGKWHFTYGQKPQPHLLPAVEENINKIRKLAKEMMAID